MHSVCQKLWQFGENLQREVFFGLAFVRSILDLYHKIVFRIDIPVAARSRVWV
jgi:hypothetical protein